MDMTTKVVHEVDEGEFSRAVSEFYDGLPYSAALALEASNDTVHAVTGSAGKLDDWDAGKLKKWQDSGREGDSPNPSVVLAAMVRSGDAPSGEYLISVCW
jgi:hypothetical protein